MMIKTQVIKLICETVGLTEEDKLATIRKILDSQSLEEVAEFCFKMSDDIKEEYRRDLEKN